MGRPPGSKNGGKAAAKKQANGAGTRPPAERKQAAAATAPGKKNGPSPTQNAEWQAEYTRLKTESRSISGLISALGGRVTSAAGKTHWKNLKKLHDLKKLDKSEAVAELENLIQQAAQDDIRISWMGNQATFADVMEQNQAPEKNTSGSRDLAVARAHSDGFNSGRKGGVPHDNPFAHAPGSPEYVAWHDGRDEGAKAAAARREGRASAPPPSPAETSSPTGGEAPAEEPMF